MEKGENKGDSDIGMSLGEGGVRDQGEAQVEFGKGGKRNGEEVKGIW